MDILYLVIGCFALLGAFDCIIGNRLGIGKEFERGIMLLGTMTLTMVGMITLAPLFADTIFLFDNIRIIFSRYLPDTEICASSVLAETAVSG